VRLAAAGRLAVVAAFAFLAWAATASATTVTVRVGYFPNITHSQALVGRVTGRFEAALAPGARVEWRTFNAGPSAIEALFAGALDVVYIGPNPAITGFVRSRGAALRIVAGATSGGAALIVRSDARIDRAEDLRGKRIATPQVGNTQDIALRAWLRSQNLRTRDKGGDVHVIPMPNADQLTLFLKKEIDAAWAPEPWASRLVREGHGRLLFDERELWPEGKFVTAHVIASTRFLRQHRPLLTTWLHTHVELTRWINANVPEAKRLLNQQIEKDLGKGLPPAILDEAFSRLLVTHDPIRRALLTSASWAFEAGLLGREPPDLSQLYDLTVLGEVLKARGLAPLP
jgi:NitT/TauT family transport system substrate-binding protein